MHSYSATISIVIPVYKEEYYLETVVKEIYKELEMISEPHEVILVDDGSPDNTWDTIIKLSSLYPMLRALRLSRHFGKESAISAGLEMAVGKGIIVMDGDLQHPPSLLPKMVRLWRESNADVVEAVKDDRGKELLKNKIGSKIFYTILNMLSGYDLRGASDFKLLDRQVVDAWLKMRETSLFFRGMIPWLGFKRVQIPFVVSERIGGKSHWSVLSLIKLAITAVTSFSSLSLHFITFIGVIFFLFAITLGGYTLFLKFSGQALSGFTTVIILQLTIGSLIMISLGIIGLYIAKIFEEVKKRPRYIVKETIDKKFND